MNNKRIIIAFVLSFLAIGLSITYVSADSELTPIQQLGKSIFFDQTLSLNQNQSCAACHAPEVGWTGPEISINLHGSVYEGSIPGSFGNRKPPSSAYATFSPILHYSKGIFIGGNFWDGRATGEKLGNPAADQAEGPFLNPREQALPDSACIVYRVCTSTYPVSFESVWGADACDITWPADVDVLCAFGGGTIPLAAADREKSSANYDKIALSIAAYEGSSAVNAFTSEFDYTRLGMAKYTQQERAGFALFQGKANCAKCHVGNGQQPLFTDFTYDNLGIPKNPENPVYAFNPSFIDLGLGGYLAARSQYTQYAAANEGKFKVPTLRNVDLRSSPEFVKAYGHNGYFKSLYGIVHFYNTRDLLDTCPGSFTEAQALAANCWPAPEVEQNLNTKEVGNLGLSPDEEMALVAFLKTLSDGYIP